MNKLLLSLIILMNTTLVFAGGTGEDLAKKCSVVLSYMKGNEAILGDSNNAIDFGNCLGVLESVRDINLFLSKSKNKITMFCPPSNGVTNIDAVKIFMAHVKKRPEHAKLAQSGTVLHAYKSAFPC